METQLSEADWNFNDVPDDEVESCCLWEYGRESAFLRSVKARSSELAGQRLPFETRHEFVGRDFSKVFSHLGRSAIFFQEGIYLLGGNKPNPGGSSRFPVSWQALPRSDRLVLVETAAWDVDEVAGFPGFKRARVEGVKAMAKLFKPKSMEEVFGPGLVPVSKFFHSGDRQRALCPNLLSRDGMEVLGVEINWGDFTNEQLVKEFAQWLKENDPPGISRPDKRGRKKISYRVKLERLGILRLLHRFSLSELAAEFPKAWKHYNSANRRWSKEASRAAVHFREMFPFVPGEEMPLSWPSKPPAGLK